MIKIVIVDDQQIVREGLKMILSLNEDMDIIGEAANGLELLELLLTNEVDVILMDIRMPIMDGIEATRKVKEKYPSIKIVILTTFNEDEYIFDVLKNGADGYILKDSDGKEIAKSIRTAFEGNVLLNPMITAKLIKALNFSEASGSSGNNEKAELLEQLTQREKEVTEYVMKGLSNKEIAKAMFVTEGTVKNYVSRILEKLELRSRAELILFLKDMRSN